MKPPTLHEEMDLLDEIEREMVRLTTAELQADCTSASPSAPTTFKTVIPAQAGTYSTYEQTLRMLSTCYGSSPPRG